MSLLRDDEKLIFQMDYWCQKSIKLSRELTVGTYSEGNLLVV